MPYQAVSSAPSAAARDRLESLTALVHLAPDAPDGWHHLPAANFYLATQMLITDAARARLWPRLLALPAGAHLTLTRHDAVVIGTALETFRASAGITEDTVPSAIVFDCVDEEDRSTPSRSLSRQILRRSQTPNGRNQVGCGCPSGSIGSSKRTGFPNRYA